MVNPNPNNLNVDPSTLSLQVKNTHYNLNSYDNFVLKISHRKKCNFLNEQLKAEEFQGLYLY